jgi:DNA-binding transcriptional regulator YdaS (Cro superfamily)
MDIRHIIKAGGGISELAAKLGLHRATVWGWKEVPPRHVINVEKVTGIPREELRPDLYPATASERAASSEEKAVG